MDAVESARQGQRAEQVLLQDHGVTVTNARFVTAQQTFALANITSVRVDAQPRTTFQTLMLLFFGLLGVLSSLLGVLSSWHSPFFGVPILFLVSLGWRATVPRYSLTIMTAGGEQSALQDRDQQKIQQVLAAVNEAIVARG